MNPSELRDESFTEMLLEEHLGGCPPPDLSERILARMRPTPRACEPRSAPRRQRAHTGRLAAALVLAGVATVVGVGLSVRGGPTSTPAQDPDGKAKAGDPLAATTYFPLTVGCRWQYRETEGDTERQVLVQAALAANVGGIEVVQFAETAGDDVSFSFFSADAAGVHHRDTLGTSGDPLFAPCEQHGIVLHSPVGAEATWSWRQLPPNRMRRGAGRLQQPRVEDSLLCNATLLGVNETLRLGDATFPCVHVRVACETDDGVRDEETWYARDRGLVRRIVKRPGHPDIVRELVHFQAPPSPPDRRKVLASAIGDAAGDAEWIDPAATDDEAWTLRSTFAMVRQGDAFVIHRVFGDRAVPFDPARLADYVALARDEDFAPRMQQLFPQRMSMALARTAGRLSARLRGERLLRDGGMSVRIGANDTKVTLPLVLAAADGHEHDVEVVVHTRDALPTLLTITPAK